MSTPTATRHPAGRRPATRLATVVAISLLGLLGFAGPASAHTELTGSTPVDGATLLTAPASVTLTFNEQVQNFAATVVVTGPDGQTYTAGDPTLDGTSITAPLTPLGSAGIYTVAYRIVSADDHPVAGQTTFAYAPIPATSAAAAAGGPVPGSSVQSADQPAQDPTTGPTAMSDPSSAADPSTSAASVGGNAVTTAGAAPTAASGDTGPGIWIWLAGGLVVAVLVIAGAAWFRTRRARGPA